LKGYKGEMIASEKLTIRDDATIAGGLVSRSFDAEGSPSRCISIVEKGRLIGFLHNLTTAKLVGIESTGNAFRDYRNEPIVFPSNVIIKHENEVSLEDLIGQTDKGIMARGVIGAYSSDYITGDFSVTLDECSLVKHGTVRRIKNVSIGGNALNLLRSIECVSIEEIQSGHFIIPYMKISNPKINIVSC
jgi:PmbA protein